MKKTAKEQKNEWFTDETFWRETYPFMFPRGRFEGTNDEMTKVLTLTGITSGTALDLCCGPGRCSVVLATRGFSVTGVDLTPFLLNKARARARRAAVKIQWVRADMRNFLSPDSFDLAISMFTSFGYFRKRHEDLAVLSNLLRSLRPGGACLIDVMGKECLAKKLLETSSEVLSDDTMLVQRHKILDDWTRVQNEWILIKAGNARQFTFQLSLYSGLELRERMEQVGFEKVKLYGSLDGDSYGPNARRLVAVGTKA